MKTVNGFTGSSVWHSLYAFPPTDQAYWDAGYTDFARRWTPILDAFDREDINFALEVHPTEIAFDLATAQRALDAVNGTRASASTTTPATSGTSTWTTCASSGRSPTGSSTCT